MSEAVSFYAGVFTGFVIFLMFLAFTPNERIEECEKDLPRSQNCVMVAIPEEIK